MGLKLYTTWQPLRTEDARTALVFGFFRHAPVEDGLNKWLREVLHRAVSALALEPSNFWPRFDSVIDGHRLTEPELVIDANDGEPLVVVVEAKPGYGMHQQEQLVREVVDTANALSASRLALIAIGADLGEPPEIASWRRAARACLDQHDLRSTEVEIRYSSWARIGSHIERCAGSPGLKLYAVDVLEQLRLHALLGYKGAPVLDDLLDMNLSNAFVAYNRAMAAARQFYLTLHDQVGFRSTGLGPAGQGHRMKRNGASVALTEAEEFFQTDTLICVYRKPSWAEDLGAYAAFYFEEGEEPKLQVGGVVSSSLSTLNWDYPYTGGVETVNDGRLQSIDQRKLPWMAASSSVEVVYDERPWRAGSNGDEDVAWTIERLRVIAEGLS